MSALPTAVRIREVGPRDGFQNEPEIIATDDKVRLIELLARTGVPRLEVTSFVRADVTDLSVLAANTFDLVYTGGHVAVWISDLSQYYAEAGRILRPGGLFIVNEGILFLGDLAVTTNPEHAQAVLDAIQKHKLEVKQVIGSRSGPMTLDQIQKTANGR